MRCSWSPTAVSWWVCLCADCWSEEEVADISLSSVSSQEIRVDESLKIVCLYSDLNKLKWQSKRMKTTLGLLYKQTTVLFFLVLFHNVRNWEFSLKNVTRSDWVTVFSSKPPVQFFPAKPPNRRKLRQNSTNQQVVLRFFPSPIMKGESVMDEPSFKLLFIHLIFVNIHEIYSSRMTKKGMFAALSSHRRVWWGGRSHRLSRCCRGLWWMSLLLVFNEHSSAPSSAGESSYRGRKWRERFLGGREKKYEEVRRKRKQRRRKGNRKCGEGRTWRSHIVQSPLEQHFLTIIRVSTLLVNSTAQRAGSPSFTSPAYTEHVLWIE